MPSTHSPPMRGFRHSKISLFLLSASGPQGTGAASIDTTTSGAGGG